MTIDCARWDRAGDAARRGPRPTTDKGDASVSIVDQILRLGEGRTLKKLDSIAEAPVLVPRQHYCMKKLLLTLLLSLDRKSVV